MYQIKSVQKSDDICFFYNNQEFCYDRRMIKGLGFKWPVMWLFGLLLCASSFFLLFELGSFPLVDYDEAIYAQVISDTQNAGDFLTLRTPDGPWFQKPPLYFWLAMESEKFFGPSEFALRFPSAILGIAAIILTCLIAFELSSNTYIALIAGTILLTTGSFLEASRQLRLDVPVTTAILFALYSFVRARKNQKWYLGVAIGIGIGVLFKSVIGIFVLPIILIWSFFDKDWSWLKNKYLWYGIGLSFLIVLPWHVYETLKFGSSFWNEYLLLHVFERFGSDINGGSTSNWQYVEYIFRYSFPWIFVFLGGGTWWFTRGQFFSNSTKRLFGIAISVLFIFGIFLIAKTKIFYYVTPIFPLIALFCALIAKEIYGFCKTEKQRAVVLVFGAILLVLGVVNTVYVGYHFQSDLATNALIVHDEYEIGLWLKDHPQPVEIRAFKYPYWDTVRYYSGRRNITLMQLDDTASQSFFMIIETYPYKQNPFPPMIMEHLNPIYEGDALTLLEFKP